MGVGAAGFASVRFVYRGITMSVNNVSCMFNTVGGAVSFGFVHGHFASCQVQATALQSSNGWAVCGHCVHLTFAGLMKLYMHTHTFEGKPV